MRAHPAHGVKSFDLSLRFVKPLTRPMKQGGKVIAVIKGICQFRPQLVHDGLQLFHTNQCVKPCLAPRFGFPFAGFLSSSQHDSLLR